MNNQAGKMRCPYLPDRHLQPIQLRTTLLPLLAPQFGSRAA